MYTWRFLILVLIPPFYREPSTQFSTAPSLRVVLYSFPPTLSRSPNCFLLKTKSPSRWDPQLFTSIRVQAAKLAMWAKQAYNLKLGSQSTKVCLFVPICLSTIWNIHLYVNIVCSLIIQSQVLYLLSLKLSNPNPIAGYLNHCL